MLNTLLAVLLLAALCVALGGAVVLPLWKWAVSSPGTYSAAVMAAAALLLVLLLAKACKKHGAAVFFRRFLKCTIVAGGLVAAATAVLHGTRLRALAAVAALCIVYGLVDIVFRRFYRSPASSGKQAA